MKEGFTVSNTAPLGAIFLLSLPAMQQPVPVGPVAYRETNGTVQPAWQAPCPGKTLFSKSMNQMTEYAQEIHEAFELGAEGLKADGIRGQAEWVRVIAAEVRKKGMAKSKEVIRPMKKLFRLGRKDSFMTP